MTGVTVGRYPGDQTAGTQVSSTYEGRYLTFLETELIHPYRTGNTTAAIAEELWSGFRIIYGVNWKAFNTASG